MAVSSQVLKMAVKENNQIRNKNMKIQNAYQTTENGNETTHVDQEDYETNTSHKDQETHRELLELSIQEDGNIIASMEMEMEMKKKKKKALSEFKCRIEDAILGNYLLGKPNKKLPPKEKAKVIQQLKEITLWGVPLLPSKRHEGTDIVLLKFLKARDFKVHDAFKMLRKTLIWRKEYMADEILEEKLDPDLEKVVYLCGTDRKGHPLCYSVFGVLKDKELYEKIFKTHEDSEKFLRRKIQCMEKGVKLLNFRVGGANSIVQITDLKNSPAPEMKELRSCVKKSMMLLQDHYPELIHKNIIINTSLWYYTCHVLTSRLINQTSTNKFVFARPSRVTETLLKYMAPENLPVEYGGLRRENDDDFSPQDHVRELNVRGNTAGCIPIPVTEPGITMVWDLTVVGWEVSYQEEFIPEDEGSYEVMLHNKEDKKGGESIRNSFYISEPGKIVITIDNTTLKKKKVFYRYKTKPTVPMYIFSKQ